MYEVFPRCSPGQGIRFASRRLAQPPATPAESIRITMLHISLALLALSAFAHAQPLPTCYNVAQTPEFNNSLTGMLNHRLETAVFGITNSACNALCASQPAVWNVQYSAEIQYGGQNECVCFGNLTTPLGDIPTTGTCGPCRDPPGATENCGTANAMNGFITGAPLQVVAVVQPET